MEGRGRVRRVLLALVRLVVGAAFVVAGAEKFVDHAGVVDDFDRWGLPRPEQAVYVVGGLEVLCGLLVLLGLATRLGALLLLLDMLGAAATAGRVDGGFHLVVPALLAALCLLLVARGGGAGQLLDRLDPVEPAR